MALPTKDQVWPPVSVKPAMDQMRIHDAWYVGNTDTLVAAYQGAPKVRDSQLQGGIVGAAARMWYGRPTPGVSNTKRLHVPIPADIATMSADLLFSEPPRFVFKETATVVQNDDGTTERIPTEQQEFIEELINTPQNHTELLMSAEVASALGGAYLRLVWDEDISEMVMLQAVHADNAIPEFRFGRLVAVTFWEVVERDEGHNVWRHLERHEKGVIRHGLYRGTDDYLGTIQDLGSHESTEWLVNQIDVDGDGIATNVEGLTATYVPNMLPQRRFRNTPGLTNYGRSDFDGIEHLFDSIDEVYNSWMRDIRLAKARLIVGAGVLTNNGPGQGQTFDAEQEVYEELNVPGSLNDNTGISAHQFQIRWQEHQETIRDLTAACLRGAGYSASTFGENTSEVQETATKVKSRERLTERTRDKKTTYLKGALGEFARTWMQINSRLFGTIWTDEIPEVRFPAEAQQDTEALARTAELLRSANAASTQTLVRMVHPEWDGETINEEVERILGETPTAVDPFSIGDPVDEDAEDNEGE